MSLKRFIKTQVFCKGNDKKEMKDKKVFNDNINDRIAIVRSKERIVFLIGVVSIFFSSIISVFAANYLYSSSEVSFDNSSSGISSDNVQGAIDELYQNASDYSSLESRIGALEGRWKNSPTSYFSDNGLVIGDGANNDSYVRLYDSNGKARADFVYGKTADTTYLVSRNSSEQWGQGKLDLKGNPVMVNGTSIGDYYKVTTTTFTTKTKTQLNAHSGSGFSTLLTNLPSVTAPSGYTLVGNVHMEITGLVGVIGFFDDINNAFKTSSIGGYAFNAGTGNISSGANIQVRIISLWKKS